ncbi:hypothetical protein GCM10027447_01970 [Glycomyces halotolerans]
MIHTHATATAPGATPAIRSGGASEVSCPNCGRKHYASTCDQDRRAATAGVA